MAIVWDQARWEVTYRANIGQVDYKASWASCAFSGGVATAVAHGLTENQFVIFRNVTAKTSVGDPAEMATYRAVNVTADTFEVAANAPGFPLMQVPDQTCEFSGSRLGEIITYGREFYEQVGPDVFPTRWANLVRDLGILTTDRILIGGCGFGYLIEAAKDAGFLNIWGVDNSAFISSRRAVEARGDVLFVEDDITGGGRVRAALRSLTGDDIFQWVISEDVLTSYAVGTEMTGLLNAAETVLDPAKPDTNVVHMVTEGPLPAPWTSLTLEQWKAVRTTNTWISIRLSEWRVL